MVAFDSNRDLNYFRERERENGEERKTRKIGLCVHVCIFVCVRKCKKKRKQKKEKDGEDSEEESNHDMCYLR